MDLVSFIHRRKPPGRRITPIGNEAIEKELLSSTCLTAWAHMSIVQRCAKIWQKYKIQVKRHKLTLFYKRHGIRCAPTYNKYYPHGHNLDQLKFRRMEFAQDLAQHIVDDHPIIYVDETTFRPDMI